MSNWVKQARAYVDASNDHDLARIRQMLAPECVYISDGVGRHEGVDAILAMMQNFFASNPDVHWQVDDYQLRLACVEFEFIITMGDKTSNGFEKIFFGQDRKIVRIEVRR